MRCFGWLERQNRTGYTAITSAVLSNNSYTISKKFHGQFMVRFTNWQIQEVLRTCLFIDKNISFIHVTLNQTTFWKRHQAAKV